MNQSNKRLLMWPYGAPGVVVQGQLAWHDANTMRLMQASGLWARLLSLPHKCLAAQHARQASAHPRSWLASHASLQSQLHAAGALPPSEYGIHVGCAHRRLQSHQRHNRSNITWHAPQELCRQQACVWGGPEGKNHSARMLPSASPQPRPSHPGCSRCHSTVQPTSTGSRPSLATSCTQIVSPMRLRPAASPRAASCS